jgi:hypothetical protein
LFDLGWNTGDPDLRFFMGYLSPAMRISDSTFKYTIATYFSIHYNLPQLYKVQTLLGTELDERSVISKTYQFKMGNFTGQPIKS